MAWSQGTSTPWDAMSSMNPMATMTADPSRMWGLAAAGNPARWPVNPVSMMTIGLETWRWATNMQVDFALATLNMVRRMSQR